MADNHPMRSDAMQTSNTGLRMKGVLDPRSVEEKKRVWQHQADLRAQGYPADFDPNLGRAWTKDECLQVKQGDTLRRDYQKIKIGSTVPEAQTPDTMDMLSIYAGLRNAGKIPAPGMTDVQIRDLYKATIEEFKNPRVVGPVVTQEERAALRPEPIKPDFSPLPLEQVHPSTLRKMAREMGLKPMMTDKRPTLVKMIREAKNGADNPADGQPRTA